jgi:hypothetical protein
VQLSGVFDRRLIRFALSAGRWRACDLPIPAPPQAPARVSWQKRTGKSVHPHREPNTGLAPDERGRVDTITCRHCGMRNDPGDRICIHCGKSLDATVPSSAPSTLEEVPPTSSSGSPVPPPSVAPPPFPPPMPYLSQATYPAAAPPSSNGLATASLVLGILGLVLFLVPVIGLILAVLAIVFGGAGISRANVGGGSRGQAIAGLVMGVVGVILLILVLASAVSVGNHIIQQISPSLGP